MGIIRDTLGAIGYALDTPGAYTRGLLAGKPGQRVGGREMLQDWGVVGENTPGLDAGDVAGFGAEMLLDPLNLVGGWALKGMSAANKAARTSNATSRAMRAAGAMPAEIVPKLHPSVIDQATGMPKRFYHGTRNTFDQFDLSKGYADDLLGQGAYMTPDPQVAETFSGMNRMGQWDGRGSPNVRMHFVDVQNPHVGDFTGREASKWRRQSGGVAGALQERGNDAFVSDRGMPQLAVFDPSQVYSPYVAPALQPERAMSPWLAALVGSNLAARTRPQGQQPTRSALR